MTRRFPLLADAELDPMQARIAGQLLDAAGGSRHGPLAMLVRAPQMSERLRPLIGYFAAQTALPKRLSEFAVLIQAARWRQEYEWWAHYQAGVDAGLDPTLLQALHDGERPAWQARDEAAVYDLCRALTPDQAVTDDQLAALRAHLDDRQIVEIVTLSGVYATLAMLLNLNDEGAPPGDAPAPRPGIGSAGN